MKSILHISDWHCNEAMFEEALLKSVDGREEPDLLVVTGDMIYDPNFFWVNHEAAAVEQRAVWEAYVYIIQRVMPGVGAIVAVPGNHDWCDYGMPGVVHSFDRAKGEVIEVEGLRIGGFRGVPLIGNPRFQWSQELDDQAFGWLMAEVDQVEPNIDMLVVHSPPHGILDQVVERGKRGRLYDKSVGIPGLKDWCEKKPSLRAVCFGHIHEKGGKLVRHDKIEYSNASCRANWLNVEFGD